MDPRGFPTTLPECQRVFPDDRACGPVGEPFSRLVTSRPVCVVCAWANIKAALFGPDEPEGG